MSEISLYADWSLARIANGEDPTDIVAFAQHLGALGKDANNLTAYGCPMSTEAFLPATQLARSVERVIRPFLP